MDGKGKGMIVRCWLGLKTVCSFCVFSPLVSGELTSSGPFQTTRALLSSPTSPSATGVPPPSVATLKEFDLLATKWIAKLYTSNPAVPKDARSAVLDGFLKGSAGEK